MMVVCGLMLVSSLALIQLTTNMNRSNNAIQYRSDADTLNEEIRALLSSDVACANTFNGIQANAATNAAIPNIKDGTAAPGIVTYSSGSIYGDRSLVISSMTLSNFVAGSTVDTATLTLTSLFAPNKGASGPQMLSRHINISVGLDTSTVNLIIKCVALSKMSDGIWRRNPLNLDNIYFSGPVTGGNVGIGTNAPGAALDINGDLRFTKNADRTISVEPPLGAGSGKNITIVAGQGSGFVGTGGRLILKGGDAGANTGGGIAILGGIGNAAGTGPISIEPGFNGVTGGDVTMVSLGAGAGLPSVGRVGIGLAPLYKLDVLGDVNIAAANVLRFGGNQVCTSVGCTAISDLSLKENIQPLQSSLENILKLQGVSYNWIDKEKYGKNQQIGLIAQNLEKIYPQAVVTDQHSGLKSVAYDHLIAPMIEAFKALNTKLTELLKASEKQSREIASIQVENAIKIKALDQEIAAKTKEIAELKTRLDKLEKTLDSK